MRQSFLLSVGFPGSREVRRFRFDPSIYYAKRSGRRGRVAPVLALNRAYGSVHGSSCHLDTPVDTEPMRELVFRAYDLAPQLAYHLLIASIVRS